MRKAKGLSREALGKLLGLEGSSITRLENGQTPVSLQTLMRCAEVCDFDIRLTLTPKTR
jgi:transcriptional regulator with XRE-family HTH domain